MAYDFWADGSISEMVLEGEFKNSFCFRFLLLALYCPPASYTNNTILGRRLGNTWNHQAYLRMYSHLPFTAAILPILHPLHDHRNFIKWQKI